MSFSKVNFRIGCHNGDRVRSRFIQPAFHQLHARREARFPPSLFLSLSFVPFRALTIATHDCHPVSLPHVSPPPFPRPSLPADARCARRTARKTCERSRHQGWRRKERERESAGSKGEGGKSLTFHARAHDSCLHEWKVLLVSCCSGALVQWSTGNAWLHPVSVHGLATTCRKITEWMQRKKNGRKRAVGVIVEITFNDRRVEFRDIEESKIGVPTLNYLTLLRNFDSKLYIRRKRGCSLLTTFFDQTSNKELFRGSCHRGRQNDTRCSAIEMRVRLF